MKLILRSALILLVPIALSACSSDGMDDLRRFVRDAHKDRKPRVEPIPEVKTQKVFAYASEDGVDPFATFNLRPRGIARHKKGGPDTNRRKEPLEDYPLDALKMVGTLSRKRQTWVIVQAPDGTVHKAQVGNYLGENFGKIIRITEEKVRLIETVQDPLGDWIKRKANLSIEE
ncbi:MAG: pilus assembly protein PilP [Proteobacteria bacterium]|nr:pilus assembly protein PilP [Pseudomonadota bacterium]